jgi:hypothetical protein
MAACEVSMASGLRPLGQLGFAGGAPGGTWLLISIWRVRREDRTDVLPRRDEPPEALPA